MKIEDLFILISNIEGVGIATVSKIITEYKINENLTNLFALVDSLRLKVEVKFEIKKVLNDYKSILKNHISYMKKQNIKLLNTELIDFDYSIKNIYNPPQFLYSIGQTNMFNNCIAVIGARNCSEYGRRVAFEIGQDLARAGFVVVSGMAYGVDASSHKGALSVGGKTIAVLGSGVDVCYPKANYNLYEQIKMEGLVLSEYPPRSTPTKYTFPQRNRLISGLCKAVIVVEAKERSGTMITVSYALEQGRQIFAVPGNINSNLSNGTNELIKNGAISYTCIDDILENVF